MTATPARIGFVTQEFRSVVSIDSAVQTKYGNLARNSSTQTTAGDPNATGSPVETFFESTADAQVISDARLTLLKGDRRRFVQDSRGVQSFTGGLDFSQVTPTVQVTDDLRGASHLAATVEISVDLGGEKTKFISWG